MSATINSAFMDQQRRYAEGVPGVGGMMHVVPVTLWPAMSIFRFATGGMTDDALYTSPWWIGVSPFEALRQLARQERRPLSVCGIEIEIGVQDALAALLRSRVKRATRGPDCRGGVG